MLRDQSKIHSHSDPLQRQKLTVLSPDREGAAMMPKAQIKDSFQYQETSPHLMPNRLPRNKLKKPSTIEKIFHSPSSINRPKGIDILYAAEDGDLAKGTAPISRGAGLEARI
jgi:hypothetical protein